MYEYISKEVKYAELESVCKKATLYFLGSFTLEIIIRRREWENPKTKTDFIKSFHEEYFAWDPNWSIERTRNRVNCVIRIIESKLVEKALEYVISSEGEKVIPEAKEMAKITLEMINTGKIEY